MPLIAFSKGNQAGETIARQLVEGHDFARKEDLPSGDGKYAWRNWEGPKGLKLVELDTLHIFSDYLKEYPLFNDADLLVFASTHRSGAGIPSLTAHLCGNWGEEHKLGGNPRQLAKGSARALKTAFEFLQAQAGRVEGFEIAIEATHHGPTSLAAPVLFMEVGCTEREWGMEEPARVVAEGILRVCEKWDRVEKGEAALGFGGMHYLDKFAQLEAAGLQFSHVASKHLAGQVTADMVRQAVEKTVEEVSGAFVEKKSLNASDRDKVVAALEEAGLEYELV